MRPSLLRPPSLKNTPALSPAPSPLSVSEQAPSAATTTTAGSSSSSSSSRQAPSTVSHLTTSHRRTHSAASKSPRKLLTGLKLMRSLSDDETADEEASPCDDALKSPRRLKQATLAKDRSLKLKTLLNSLPGEEIFREFLAPRQAEPLLDLWCLLTRDFVHDCITATAKSLKRATAQRICTMLLNTHENICLSTMPRRVSQKLVAKLQAERYNKCSKWIRRAKDWLWHELLVHFHVFSLQEIA